MSILDVIKKALENRSFVIFLIKEGIKRVDEKKLIESIEKNVYIDNILFNHFSPYMYSHTLKPLIKTVIQLNWDLVEYFLLNPENLRNVLVETHPNLKEILYSKKGIEWLNNNCKRGYDKLYKYAWLT